MVAKLWGLVRPHVSVFGEKDYQQLAIVRRMHADLFFDGEVAAMPIVREPDGLAMSSRNVNLSAEDRTAALAMRGYLLGVRSRYDAGERSRARLLMDAAAQLRPGRLDYVDLVDANTLEALSVVEGPAVVAAAAFFGGVRLLDNILLGDVAS